MIDCDYYCCYPYVKSLAQIVDEKKFTFIKTSLISVFRALEF